MALTNEHTSVVNGLSEAELVDAGLQATLQEVFSLEGEHVIELHAGLIEHANSDETPNEGIAFEETLWVLLVEGEEFTIISVSISRTESVHCC